MSKKTFLWLDESDAQLQARANDFFVQAGALDTLLRDIVEEQLVRACERQLPEAARGVVTQLRFNTSDYDNGYFFSSSPSVYVLGEGDVELDEWSYCERFACEEIDLDDTLMGTVSDLWGPIGDTTELVVDLVARTVAVV